LSQVLASCRYYKLLKQKEKTFKNKKKKREEQGNVIFLEKSNLGKQLKGWIQIYYDNDNSKRNQKNYNAINNVKADESW